MNLLIAARVAHIVSSILWAGFVAVIGLTLSRTPRRENQKAARAFRRTVVRRARFVVIPSVVTSLVSGIYLLFIFRGIRTPRAQATLELGAAFAILSLLTIYSVGRPAETKLAALDKQTDDRQNDLSKETPEMIRLNRRVEFASYGTAALLILAVLVMSVARYFRG